MKTHRLELRLDAELRLKLDELAKMAGKPASVVVRKLVLAAHMDAFGQARPSAASDVRRATAQAATVAKPEDNMTLEEVLETAGIYMGPSPTPEGNDEPRTPPMTVTSTQAGP